MAITKVSSINLNRIKKMAGTNVTSVKNFMRAMGTAEPEGPYVPPEGDDVNFSFPGSYSAPSGDDVDFDF